MYVPSEEEQAYFERRLEQEGIEDDREIQQAWQDFCYELNEREFQKDRNYW